MVRIIKTVDDRNTQQVGEFQRDVLEMLDSNQTTGLSYVDPAIILAEARVEAESKVREAFEEGMKRGQIAGEEQFQQTVGHAAELLLAATEALQNAREEFLTGLEPQVVELASMIAAKVLAREASIDPELVRSTARQALNRIVGEERVTLQVNPNDLAVLREYRVTLLEEFEGIETLEIVGDDGIESGGCIALTEKICIDASLTAQISEIMDHLAR